MFLIMVYSHQEGRTSQFGSEPVIRITVFIETSEPFMFVHLAIAIGQCDLCEFSVGEEHHCLHLLAGT